MRTAFIETLCEEAANDQDIWLVTGDLGYSVLEVFAEKFPDRYLNAGVAEQNMTGIASGLALSGKTALTYSIANFPTLRCLEQIRNDACYNRCNVKVVSVGGGFSYGNLGYSHHGVEDLSILRSLPGMAVIAPADPVETRYATRAILKHQGPCYLRLGKAKEPVIHESEIDFEIGKGIQLCDGEALTLMSTGGMLETAMQVAKSLHERGASIRVVSMHTVSPIDEDAIERAAKETGGIATLEEHSVVGGLGSAVLDVMQERGLDTTKTLRLGIPHEILSAVGSQSYLREQAGISPERVEERLAIFLGL